MSRKKSNGEGSVYFSESRNSWVGQISIRRADGSPARKTFYGKKKSEALKKIKDYEQNNITLSPLSEYHTLRTWIPFWLESKNIELKDLSLNRYTSICKHHLLPYSFSNTKLSNITNVDLKLFYALLKEDGKSDQTILQLNSILRAAFYDAIKYKLILTNPCSGIKLKKSTNSIIKAFTLEEQNVFVQYLNGVEGSKEPLKQLFLFTLATGVRLGEALALCKRDLSIEDRLVNIDKQVQYIKIGDEKYKHILNTPKTYTSIRKIEYPSSLDNFCRGLLSSPYDLLFADKKGNYIDVKRPNRTMERICEKLQLPKMTYHNLRHTYATRLFEKGVSPKTIMLLLGHANINTTMNIYTHVMPYMKTSAVESLNDIFTNLV